MLDKEHKNLLTENLKSKVFEIRGSILKETERLLEEEKKVSTLYKKAYSAEQETLMQQWIYVKKRIEQLTQLKQSPFFAKYSIQ